MHCSGSLAERATAAGQRSVCEYDRDGLLKGVRCVDAEGVTAREIAYEHDEFDRVTKIDFGGGHWRSVAYDRLGRPATVKVSDGKTVRTVETVYDDFDRAARVSETAVRGDARETTVTENSYDARGRLAAVRVVFPDGSRAERAYAYDRYGRLAALTADGRALRYAYDAMGQVETQEIAGIPVRYEYDRLGRLTGKRVLGPGGEVLASLRYFYANNGSLAAREVNDARQELVTDARGQLTAVRDPGGKTLESYVYDPAGNLLEKVVRGRSTKYEYDAANQLTAQTTDAGTPQEKRVEFAYDGAGRMTREGQREYRYGGLDKVVAVLEAGRTVAEFAYGADGQLASIERKNGEHERLWWRGLALTRRDYLNGKEVVSSERYLNEPHATGGNPVLAWEGKSAPASAKEQARAAATRLLFNDMLGSTISVIDGDRVEATNMTLFGETPDGQAQGFFTGKPHIDELGYAFLFRNYRPEKAKWQTADPLGYPDGWNALAYVNNGVCLGIDLFGCLTETEYQQINRYIAQNLSGITAHGIASNSKYCPNFSDYSSASCDIIFKSIDDTARFKIDKISVNLISDSGKVTNVPTDVLDFYFREGYEYIIPSNDSTNAPKL